MAKKSNYWILMCAIFVIATCGLVYELIAGTLASYLLGDSVTQFSTIIGTYLFAMGIGSYLSKYIEDQYLFHFIRIEILVGLFGGCSAAFLFLIFNEISFFRIILYFNVLVIGVLVGLEIPLMMRILKDEVDFKNLVSEVFTFDYIGALFASLLFPLFFIPHLGIVKTSFLFGIMNIGVAIYLSYTYNKELGGKARWLQYSSILAMFLLLLGFVFGDKIMMIAEQQAYNEKIIYSKTSVYQRIVVTKNKFDTKFYLNNNLQFSSFDEYRYHEALVHPVMSQSQSIENVLILGGGDGLALREVLKYKDVKKVFLIDLDPFVTELFKNNQFFARLNQNAFHNLKAKVINDDAFEWIKNNDSIKFNVVIVDFPDPTNYSVGKLYTSTFYQYLKKILAPDAKIVIQSTSPYVAPKSFWCVDKTLQVVGFKTLPYHCYVPSFGEWGYIMAGFTPHQTSNAFRPIPKDLKFYSQEIFDQMQVFPNDMKAYPEDYQRLNNQILISFFEQEWAKVSD